jgi:hypothetical protein
LFHKLHHLHHAQTNTSGVLLVGEDALRHERILPNVLYKDAMGGSRWWRAHVFSAKTYVEARSLFQLLLAYYRVYSLYLVLLAVMTTTVGQMGALQKKSGRKAMPH